MRILIVYTSESGNTKKVVDMVKENLTSKDHVITIRNALTVKRENINESDLLIIGTPVHGYILFGHKPAKPVRNFLKSDLLGDLSGKPVIGFATYLFFPAGALKPLKKAIHKHNGKLLGLITNQRSKKSVLATNITECVLNYIN